MSVNMEILQIYETTVISKSSDHELAVVVIPGRSLPQDIPVETVLQELRIKKHASTSPSTIARDLAVILSPRLSDQNAFQILRETVVAPITQQKPSPEFQPSEDDVSFAEYVSFKPVIPVEESPLSLDSLANLARVGGVTIGAYVGFVAFGSSPPLLMISVPTGMIICGAAYAVGQALQEGLKERILSWLKGEKCEEPKKTRRTKQGREPEEGGPTSASKSQIQ
jgi:hypothetical protein